MADIDRRDIHRVSRSRCQTARRKDLRAMTMRERLEVHRQIEAENHEHMNDFMCKMYWESLSVKEVASMIQEKDRRMEWDDQFSFLCWLHDEKMKEERK